MPSSTARSSAAPAHTAFSGSERPVEAAWTLTVNSEGPLLPRADTGAFQNWFGDLNFYYTVISSLLVLKVWAPL